LVPKRSLQGSPHVGNLAKHIQRSNLVIEPDVTIAIVTLNLYYLVHMHLY